MKALGLAVLAAVAFFSIVTLLKAPWPVSAFVCLPLYTLGLAGLVIRHNVSARPSWEPDAAVSGRPDFPGLRIASELAEAAGLRRIGDFRRPTLPENGMRVFRQPDGPSVVCIRRYENDLSFECVTFLDDGGDLTTTTDVRTRHEPRPFRRLLLISRTADPLALLEEHLEGVRLLAENGKHAVALNESRFLQDWTAREADLVRHLRSSGRWWPFRVLEWRIVKEERGYGVPLRNRGLTSAPRPVPGKQEPESVNPLLTGETSGPDVRTETKPDDARLFRVVFRGAVREGFDAGRVKASLAFVFRLDGPKADALFSGRTVSVKSGVDRGTALRYQKAFHRAGALAELEPLGGTAAETLPAGKAVPLTVRDASSAAGVAQAGPKPEDPDTSRFRIEALLAAERRAFELEKSDALSVGWPGYALAVSSFVPYIGIIGSPLAFYYGMKRKRSGGGRIIVWSVIGGLVSSLASIGGIIPHMGGGKTLSAFTAPAETRTRLIGLVAALEAYRGQTGDYPESLETLADAADTLILITDPMGADIGAGTNRSLYYRPDRSGEFYFLLSPGADGRPGTADDITPDLPAEELSRTGWRPLE